MSLLRELGYANVSHYPGGLMEWLEFNLPTEPPSGGRPALAHPSRDRSGPVASRPAAVQPRLAPRPLHFATG